jgi:hypothetical protein
MRFGAWWLTVLLASAGCEGVIGDLMPPGGMTGGGTGSGDVYVPPEVACDPSQYPNAQLETAAALFASDVYPALTEGASRCDTCHGATSGRRFTLTSSATETFYAARGAGFFGADMGSLLSRVTNPDDRVRMPSGAPALPNTVVQALGRVGCMLRSHEQQGGMAADEQFPPELLLPYTGPAVTSYDNPFLNFVQLKSKVRAVFDDRWVRGGVDQFERNIGLFGGVNFSTHFVEARAATPEFLLGLDALAPDVCGAAADAGTGPFAGLDVTAPVIDVPAEATTQVEFESLTPTPATGAGNASTNPAGYFCYTNCTFAAPYTVLAPGTYRVAVRARPTLDGNGVGPQLRVQVGAVTAASTLEYSVAGAYETKSVELTLTEPGATAVSINFFNDAVVNGGDRNVYLDSFTVTGPLGPGTGTTRAAAAKQRISTLYTRMLYRPATAAEQDSTWALLTDLTAFGPTPGAWSGVCEALVRHPDFLFTMPPMVEKLPSAQRDPLRLVALTQRALGRPPTSAEFAQLASSGFPALIDAVFASPDFRDYYFNRIRLRIESQGTPVSDEPARIWTYVTVNGRSFEEVLTAAYTVDENFQQQQRPAEHGKTGLLTARGYLNNKPGLPHYNFPARVLSGFMGSVFEVPPEVFDQRGTATATSTVDPSSVCFSCHQLLTPLAHQRLRWADDGTYRTETIDDSDRGLVETYPYKGVGLEAFTTKAVKKEAFVRRMINTQVRLLLGRELRARDDERVLYKQLWELTFANNGDLRPVLKALAASPVFQGAP